MGFAGKMKDRNLSEPTLHLAKWKVSEMLQVLFLTCVCTVKCNYSL